MAKEFLSQRGVPYIEKDVSRDPMAASELQRLGQRGVPVIMIDGQMVVGFDRARLERLLARASAEPRAERPKLGASIADAARHAPPGSPAGAFVGRVRPGSPAARAGPQPGDIIVALAGQPVDSATAVERMLRRLESQRPVLVRIYRNGRTSELLLDLQPTWERRSRMYELLVQRVRQDVMVILQDGGERAAVRRAVRMQVISALGEGEVTAVSVQQIAYAAIQGSFQAAEQTDLPIEIVGEEASAGVLEAVREKDGKATSYLPEAIQGAIAAVEESAAKLREKASEIAERSRKALQSLIERLKGSPQGVGGEAR